MDMAASISSLLIECLSLFNAQVARDDLVAHDAEVPQSLWLDELGRLRVWAANIGAHQVGQSSLDYRLRDASHIKDQIIRLLERLQRLQVDLKEVLSAPPGEPEDQLSDDEDTTELEQIYNGFVEVISSLFQMSMLIRRPARHDRLLGSKKEDCVAFEPYDRQHILEKFPRADAIVGDRLGSAISRRRADLKYRERHHAKLSQGINHAQIAGHKESHSIRDRDSTVFSETIATEYKEPNIQFDETGSHSGMSQTSDAPTLLEGGNAISVPPPPKESANEQPFECPYCFFITTIKDKRSWARHVFRDIMPYVCIFADCPTPNRLYDSRREWYEHITDSHISLSNAGELHECALCHEAGFSTPSLERHLGRHLEELALFALPRPMGNDDIDSDRLRHSSKKQAAAKRQKYRREQPNEFVRAIERDRSRDRKRDWSRDRARDRDRSRRSPSYEPERGDKGRDDASVLAWIPSAGIDYDVIYEDLPHYMGAGSTVERANHPKDGRPGYLIRGPYTLTIPMITDLKRDTIDWQEERVKTGNKDYRKSETRYRRQRPTNQLPKPKPVRTNPQQVDSIPFTAGRHDRSGDPRENYADVLGAQSPLSYVPESLSQISSQEGFNEPIRSSGLYSRRQTTEITAHDQNVGVTRNAPVSPSQPGSPTKEDLRKVVAQKLQSEGHSRISVSEFDRLVDEAWQRLQQRQTSGQAAPSSYSEPEEQPSTTGYRGFHIPATAGPKPSTSYPQYQYRR